MTEDALSLLMAELGHDPLAVQLARLWWSPDDEVDPASRREHHARLVDALGPTRAEAILRRVVVARGLRCPVVTPDAKPTTRRARESRARPPAKLLQK
jgi:hypothetical protein